MEGNKIYNALFSSQKVELKNVKELNKVIDELNKASKEINSLSGKAKEALNTLQNLKEALKQKENVLDNSRGVSMEFRKNAKELGIDPLNSDVYKEFEKAKNTLMDAEKNTGVPYSIISKL